MSQTNDSTHDDDAQLFAQDDDGLGELFANGYDEVAGNVADLLPVTRKHAPDGDAL